MNTITLTGIIKVIRETMPFSLIGSYANGLCLQHSSRADFIGRGITTSEVVREKPLNDKAKLIRTNSGSVYLVICD